MCLCSAEVAYNKALNKYDCVCFKRELLILVPVQCRYYTGLLPCTCTMYVVAVFKRMRVEPHDSVLVQK